MFFRYLTNNFKKLLNFKVKAVNKYYNFSDKTLFFLKKGSILSEKLFREFRFLNRKVF